ncbi:MAG TPA: class I SAM-dependent methyltransferase [Anaerovoracaceae bacterium]|nr:class I SAM-dependent methyltransferase [Anaerovoracaceae bacterium]
MRFNDIFDIQPDVAVFTYADNYMEQSDTTSANLMFRQIGMDSPEIVGLVDEGTGKIYAVSVFNPKTDDMPDDFWVIFTNIVSNNPEFEVIVHNLLANDRIKIRTIQYGKDEFNKALIEYYSLKLMDTSFCDGCRRDRPSYNDLYPQDRVDSLKSLLESVMESRGFNLGGMSILEICCGNGFSTMALKNLGCDVLSIDIEKCDICDGLYHEILDPNHTIYLDATRLSHIFGSERFECTAGFMLGAIYPFNQSLWENIIKNAFAVTKKGGMLLFTVNKKEEIIILKNKLDSLGAIGSIQENPNSVSVYDKWIYVGQR